MIRFITFRLVLQVKLLIFIFFVHNNVFAQCNFSAFTVTATNGNCIQNASIAVQIPNAVSCMGWNAILTRPDNSEMILAIPADGAPVYFSQLAAGSYRVRLFNGITTQQWGANPIVLTTSYVNMTINSTATATACAPTSPNFSNNASLSITVASGGTGPFYYSVTSSLGTQYFGATSSISHNFTGLPGNETVAFTVVDSANNQLGCPTSQSQTRLTPLNTLSLFFEGGMYVSARCRATNYSGCDNAVSLNTRIRQTGAPMVTHWGQYRLNGGAWSAPSLGVSDNTHSIFASPGDFYEFRAYNNCDTIYRSGIVQNPPAKIMYLSIQNVPNGCGYTYRINTDDQTTLCLPATYLLEYFNGSSWDSVSTFTTSSQHGGFDVSLTGTYRVTVNDGCNTLTRLITVPQATLTLNSISLREGNSTLEGTSSIYFNPLPPASFIPLTVTITPMYPYTNPVTVSATQPIGWAGTYNITFPYTRIFTNTGGTYDNHVLSDLPLGQYQVDITDNCGNSITRIVNLTNPTTYNPTYNVVIGCANSNTLYYNLNSSNRFGFRTSTNTGMFELRTMSNNTVVGTTLSDNMVFNNLPSGYYVIRAYNTLPDAQHFANPSNKFSVARGVVGMQSFIVDTVFVPPYQDISISTQIIACDNSSGIIAARITGGTPVYPLIYNLYDATGTTLIATDTAHSAAAANATNNIFETIPLGNYVLNIISGYSALTPNGCFSSNQNILLNNTRTTTTAEENVVCISDNTTQLGIALDTAYWNISWYDATGGLIAANINTISISPTTSTAYYTQYQLKSNLGCFAPPLLVDTVLITVINEPDTLGKTVLGDTICAGNSATIQLLNANAGIFYEIFRNGSPLSPRIYQTASADGLLSFSIPDNQLTAGTNTFQINASNTSCNGGYLNETAIVFVDIASVAPIIAPILGTVCPNTNVTLNASSTSVGSGAVLNWYSGQNGSGSHLGTGNSIVIAPTSTTTVYARIEGACNTTADAAISINTKYYVYAANGTTSNTFCTDNAGWQHFYTGDEIIFSVKGDISAAPAGFPIATIYDNGAYYQDGTNPNLLASCINEERFEMERSWDLNMGGAATSGTYEIRFYYEPAERIAIENAASNWAAANQSCGYTYKYPTPLGFYWFKNSGASYIAPLYDGGHYQAVGGTTFNNINYAQWADILSFSGGSGAVILTPNLLLATKWEYFKGHSLGRINKLEWAMRSEENTDKFEIQRSKDGTTFETIATVQAQGDSEQMSYYSFDDINPLAGDNYYRIRLINRDLSHEFSNVLVLHIAAFANSYSFYPNPTKDELFYQFSSDNSEPLRIDVLDILGRVVHTQSSHLSIGINTINTNLSTITAGTYIVRVSHLESGLINTAKIIKN